MGIKERREREKQITRQAILEASLKIARTEGWPALTIRKVGELIEYSPPMVYEYFASKEEILLALVQEGFSKLNAAMQEAAQSSEAQNETRLQLVAEAYWDFAVTHPQLYQLMHGMGGVMLDKDFMLKAVQEVCQTAQAVLADWLVEKQIELGDIYGATEIVWCLLHGLVSLHLIERVQGEEARAKNLLKQAIAGQLLAWQNGLTLQ